MHKDRQIFIYQIFYDEATKALLDPGFIQLDNRSNLRPDWFEYWSIRKILLGSEFGADDYIGFFSPKFFEKTRTTSAQVRKVANTSTHEVISFSPFLAENALFQNCFQQGDLAHPGLFETSELLIKYLNIDLNIRLFVGDITNTIYSNYFVAKFSFWKEWFSLFEKIFDLCENKTSPLTNMLNSATCHDGVVGPQMKIFFLERLVTILLARDKKSAALGIDYKSAPNIQDPENLYVYDLLICDALKAQFVRTGAEAYSDVYWTHRLQTVNNINSIPRKFVN